MEAIFLESTTNTFLSLGRLAIDTVLPVFSLFKDERVVQTIAVLMVLFAINLANWFACIIWRLKRDVTRRLDFLKDCKDCQGFFSKFDEFDALMMRNKLLKHRWYSYNDYPSPATCERRFYQMQKAA